MNVAINGGCHYECSAALLALGSAHCTGLSRGNLYGLAVRSSRLPLDQLLPYRLSIDRLRASSGVMYFSLFARL